MTEQATPQAENDTIGQRRNADGTFDLGITGDRAMVHITDAHLTLDPEVEIRGSRHRGFRLSAAFTPVTCLTTTRTWIEQGGDTYDLNALLGDAQERGQRTLPLADYRLFSPDLNGARNG